MLDPRAMNIEKSLLWVQTMGFMSMETVVKTCTKQSLEFIRK